MEKLFTSQKMQEDDVKFRNEFKERNGFTLIELIVAMAIFSMVIVAVINIFMLSWDAAQRAFSNQNVQDAGRYILESMGKELRMSVINTEAGGPYKTINITNSEGQIVNYSFDGANKRISRDSQSLAPDKVEVTGDFYVLKSDFLKPRITVVMMLKGKEIKASQQGSINLQTTISSRQYAQ